MSPDLTQFSKFEHETSPEAYLQSLKGEFELKGIKQDTEKMKYLPLLLKGKTSYFAETLRSAPDWTSMMAAFTSEFTVDPNVIIGELRSVRCYDYNVDAFTEKFLASANKLDKSN